MYQAEFHCRAPSTLHSLHRGEKTKKNIWLGFRVAERAASQSKKMSHPMSAAAFLPAQVTPFEYGGRLMTIPLSTTKQKEFWRMGFSQGLRRFTQKKKSSATQMKHVPRPWMSWSLPKKLIDPKGVAGDVLKCNFSVPKRLVQELLLIWSMDIFLESCPPK